MEEVLNNQQVRPGDETQFMHAIFSSDEEMMTFYLTLNRFMNPGTYMVERTDQRRLEDLEKVLYNNVGAFEVVDDYKAVSIKEVIKGFGMCMMNTQISNSNRMQNAEAVCTLMEYVLNNAKNIWQFKQMKRLSRLHIENVKYLRKKLKAESDGEKNSEDNPSPLPISKDSLPDE